jgi:hypothetical protein
MVAVAVLLMMDQIMLAVLAVIMDRMVVQHKVQEMVVLAALQHIVLVVQGVLAVVAVAVLDLVVLMGLAVAVAVLKTVHVVDTPVVLVAQDMR